MELLSLAQASIVADVACGPVGGEQRGAGWRWARSAPAVPWPRRFTVSVFHNVFYAYEASEVRIALESELRDGADLLAADAALVRRADEVLLSAGWGTATWGSVGAGRWLVPAFDLSDPDVPLFLERALVGGKLYLTRHTDKIGRYLRHVGGPELMSRFIRSVAVQYPEMAARLTAAWQL